MVDAVHGVGVLKELEVGDDILNVPGGKIRFLLYDGLHAFHNPLDVTNLETICISQRTP